MADVSSIKLPIRNGITDKETKHLQTMILRVQVKPKKNLKI